MKFEIYDQFVRSNQLYNFRTAKVKAIDTLLEKIKQNEVTGTDYQMSIYSAQQLVSYRFNSQMVYKLAVSKARGKKAKIALPNFLLKHFRLQSYNVSHFSIICNIFQDIILMIRSLVLATKNLRIFWQKKLGDLIEEKKRAGYTVVMLNPSFPQGDIFSDDTEFNFINWQIKKLPKKVCFIHFNKNFKNDKIGFKKNDVLIIYVPKLKFDIEFIKRGTYYKNCIKTLIKSGSIISSKFFMLLKFIDQVIISEQIKMTTANKLPDIIIFSDSHGILRPYWTYALQEKNVKIQYYFFSSYDSPAVVKNEDPRIDFWRLNNWPEIYCVDDYQSEFINRNKISANQKVIIGGFPDFTDFPIELDSAENRYKMLVFDYEPRINHFGYSSINDAGYHTFESNQLFLNLLYELAIKLNILILHKPKRVYSDIERKVEYIQFLESLDSNVYRCIHPKVSPRKIIHFSDIVISKPITSTAFIAKESSKVSIFFDPIGKVSKDDPALRNLKLFNTIDSLSKYVEVHILSEYSGR